MQSWINPQDAWPIWGILAGGVALCIYLEQNYPWAARLSGPVLALLGGMTLSNLRLMPGESTSYDLVETYLVPAAIPLLLFRANLTRIFRETGPMFRAFHVATLGTIIGAFVAGFIFRISVGRVAEVTGVMTASYIGGGVNFVAVKNHYQLSPELTNPLLVADNFIMAGMFGLLFLIANSKFFRKHYPHPHSLENDQAGSQALAARHWERKGIALLDIAKALAVAFAITALSMKIAESLKATALSPWLQSIVGSAYLWITVLAVAVTTLFHKFIDGINGADELGIYLLYLFFFVIGLHADLFQVIRNVPVLFLLCLVIAAINLAVTLVLGKLFRMNLEELLLSVNATLGGAPSAVAMAVSAGWSRLVLPGLLAGVWGYVIGTFIGIAVAEALLRLLKT